MVIFVRCIGFTHPFEKVSGPILAHEPQHKTMPFFRRQSSASESEETTNGGRGRKREGRGWGGNKELLCAAAMNRQEGQTRGSAIKTLKHYAKKNHQVNAERG